MTFKNIKIDLGRGSGSIGKYCRHCGALLVNNKCGICQVLKKKY